ncbi:MAG: hypothetical protein JWN48_3776 [Myxococcaceae bacterium]|nr:hypothetical protein [Myxococcaceae bacterium]
MPVKRRCSPTGSSSWLAACALLGVGLSSACDDASSAPGALDAAAVAFDAGLSSMADTSVAPALDAGALDARAALQYARLVDNQSWQRYDAALDPLPSHEPDPIVCQDSATYLEYGSYEVDTTRCNYLLAQAPALRDVPVGSRVRVNFLHYDLLAASAAEAHLALLFGDSLQWEKFLPIPAPGDGFKETFVTSQPLAQGSPIRLHLHNHGGNTYLLVALEVVQPSE